MPRKPKLDSQALRRVDEWLAAHPNYHRHFKVLAWRMGVSLRTIYDAAHRRKAYQEGPREN